MNLEISILFRDLQFENKLFKEIILFKEKELISKYSSFSQLKNIFSISMTLPVSNEDKSKLVKEQKENIFDIYNLSYLFSSKINFKKMRIITKLIEENI